MRLPCKQLIDKFAEMIAAKFMLLMLTHPSAAYMRRWTVSALVQVVVCRLFGAKPLPEPMVTHCQLDPYEQTSEK